MRIFASTRFRSALLTVLSLGAGCATTTPALQSPATRDVASPAATMGSSEPQDPISARIAALAAEHHAIGLCAALVDIEKPTRTFCTGVRRNDRKDRLIAGDRFHLGSDTKAMTATLAALLIEDGLIGWDTTLAKTFPKMKIEASLRDVTLSDLLTHRSGITGELNGPLEDVLVKLHERTDDLPSQRRWLTALVLSQRPEKAPRSEFIYSNFGYVVAGAMLEQTSGKAWEDLIQERVFKPLNMASCGFGAPASVVADSPYGHLPSDGAFVPVPPGPGSDNPAALGPAATVHCNLEDWGRFVNAHLIGETGASPLLSKESYTRLHTPPPYGKPADGQDYAMGWIVVTNPKTGGRALSHAGSNTMFYAEAWLFPDNGRGYLVGMNQAGADAEAAANAVILDLFQQVPPRAPRTSP